VVGFKFVVDNETANRLNGVRFPIKMKLIDGVAYFDDGEIRDHPIIEIYHIERVNPVNETDGRFKVIAYGRFVDNT